jgi:hypothetical protein
MWIPPQHRAHIVWRGNGWRVQRRRGDLGWLTGREPDLTPWVRMTAMWTATQNARAHRNGRGS